MLVSYFLSAFPWLRRVPSLFALFPTVAYAHPQTFVVSAKTIIYCNWTSHHPYPTASQSNAALKTASPVSKITYARSAVLGTTSQLMENVDKAINSILVLLTAQFVKAQFV